MNTAVEREGMTMSRNKRVFEPGRRSFMRTAAFGGGAAVMLGGAGIGAAVAHGYASAKPAASQPRDASGYHVTEHIREYYRKASF
jgi:nitrous oxide reductase